MDIIKAHHLVFQNTIKYPDITIKEGEITFVSGDSGCGKTTLFKLLNATINASHGDIYYCGENIKTLDKIKLRREVMLVSQVPFLFSGSILDNFKMYHTYHESTCPSEQHIQELLGYCCYKGDIHNSCDVLSGGERQRIFQSIALSLKPKVLLLDEPTSALQGDLAKEVMKNIIAYVKQYTMSLVVISHDVSLTATYAQQHIILRASV